MTYGTLPTKAEFRKAFNALRTDGYFNIRRLSLVKDGSYTCDELYKRVQSLIRYWNSDSECNDLAGDSASAILYALGFEWI